MSVVARAVVAAVPSPTLTVPAVLVVCCSTWAGRLTGAGAAPAGRAAVWMLAWRGRPATAWAEVAPPEVPTGTGLAVAAGAEVAVPDPEAAMEARSDHSR